jgi:hypothetical protein
MTPTAPPCVPGGTLDRPIPMCVQAHCLSDDDCTDRMGGICAPVDDPCTEDVSGFFCVYPEGCRTNADCGADRPPAGRGDRFCESGSCATVLQGEPC